MEFPKGNLHSAFYYSSMLPGRLKVKNVTGEQFTHTAAAVVGMWENVKRVRGMTPSNSTGLVLQREDGSF